MRAVAFALLALLSLDAAGDTAVRILARDGARCLTGTLRAECDGCSEPRTTRWSARDGVAYATLDLSSASRWRVQAIAEGCWSMPSEVAGNAEVATFTLWPSARLLASLAPPRGEKGPETVQLRVRGKDIPDAVVDCTRAKERWSCEVPATELDVRIGAPGFVPHYFWSVRPGFDAGALVLQRGASISGRAALPLRESGPITVTLAPDAFTDTPARANLGTFTTKTNDRGFFQFAGFAPGSWTVTATKNGWSPAQARVVVSEPGETALAEVLTLRTLARVELTLDPPRDIGGADWMVKLEREPSWGMRTPVAESASSEGRWLSEPLEAGLYFITVRDANGTVVHTGGQMIDTGTLPLAIRIDRVVVRGTVTLAGEPVKARLTFNDSAGKRVRMMSDTEGYFEGAVARTERAKWSVQVTPDDTGSTITLRDVVIDEQDGVADVDIELPEGRITGKTVDDAGQPVRAFLVVRGGNSSAQTTSDTDGTFTIAGLEPGDVELRASTREVDSGFMVHTIHGAEDDPLTLVLPRKLKASVTIETPSGRPFAGAIVYILTAGKVMVDSVSGPNGRVSIASPSRDPVAYVIVNAPGYPLTMRAVPLAGDDEARRVRLSSVSGKVLVPPETYLGRRGMPVVNLYAWRDPPPNTFRNAVQGGWLLDLEPGEYRFCADLAQQRCVDRVVTPGSQQRIELPQ
ncbi:MAG TPA: hypothetical protein VEO54_27760 [Thermoanaerobaculia bacterium]|nr:hypothetical protein [Thermoanaerobaculia bacterium]